MGIRHRDRHSECARPVHGMTETNRQQQQDHKVNVRTAEKARLGLGFEA